MVLFLFVLSNVNFDHHRHTRQENAARNTSAHTPPTPMHTFTFIYTFTGVVICPH